MIECPGCGGNLEFDILQQKMLCKLCNSTYSPEEVEKYGKEAKEEPVYEVMQFTCTQCGGELYSEEQDITSFCPYCGSTHILQGRISKQKRPDYIIPFKKTKEECKKEYIKFVKHSPFLPKEYKDIDFIDGFRGIYMPYWSYNLENKSNIKFMADKSKRKGDYIYTDHYMMTGDLEVSYDGIIYDASSSFDDTISSKVAPFNIKNSEEFSSGYLCGFYADTADVSETLYDKEAKQFAMDNIYNNIKAEQGLGIYDIKKESLEKSINMETKPMKLYMLPVWFLSYRKKAKVAYIAMNGQNGKIAADMPINPISYLIASLLIAVPLFFVFNFLLQLTPRFVMGAAIAADIITLAAYYIQNKEMNAIRFHSDDKGYRKVLISTRWVFFDKWEKQWLIPMLLAGVIGVVEFIRNPFSDDEFYAAIAIVVILVAISYVGIIKCRNMTAFRRLPQFDKRGGHDNA